MKYYIFNIDIPNDDNYTVVFDYNKDFSQVLIREDVTNFHLESETCKKVIYIQPDNRDQSIDFSQQIASIFKLPVDHIRILNYGRNGVAANDQSFFEILQYHGLMSIVRSRNAVLEGDDTFHFILPSKKHSPFFIRTANILRNDNEIAFIAFCLFNEVKGEKFKHIVCDTSSIISIGYSLLMIYALFEEIPSTSIQSFESYYKVDSYPFRPKSLILISATNSGKLEKELKSQTSEKDLQIVSIICNFLNPDCRHLVNIKKEFLSLLVRKNVQQYSGNNQDCEYCSSNSIPVLVRGEQFIPSRVLVQRILIFKRHVPSWIKNTIDLIGCSGAIKCFKSENVRSKKREIFIDFKSLLDSNTKQGDLFGKVVDKTLKNNVPLGTSLIIYLKDSSSKLISTLLEEKLKEVSDNLPLVISHTNLSEIKKEEKEKTHTIVVIASCVTTGNKLNSISRELRDFKNSSIHYLNIITRLPTKKKRDVLESNLKYRKDKTEHVNVFNSSINCFVGDYHDKFRTKYKQPPWCEEQRFWEEFDETNCDFLNDRIELLQSENYLLNNLFFNSPFTKKELVLRENFALYDFDTKDKPSQADVYFIFSGVFHHLRHPENDESKKVKTDNHLIQHEHVKSIIDPECFTRFNDGIAQACILRLARPLELSYLDEDDSKSIKDVLLDLFKNADDHDSNEAIIEFLFAIASGKMKLQSDHLHEFCDLLDKNFSNVEEVVFFSKCIRSTHCE